MSLAIIAILFLIGLLILGLILGYVLFSRSGATHSEQRTTVQGTSRGEVVEEAKPARPRPQSETPEPERTNEDTAVRKKPTKSSQEVKRQGVDPAAPLEQIMSALEAKSVEKTKIESAKTALTAWLTWLYQRPKKLAAMSEPERVQTIHRWWEELDRYVWLDPADAQELSDDVLGDFWSKEERGEFLQRLRTLQEQFRQVLSEYGIQRIETTSGEPFQRGLLEPKSGETIPTRIESLDDKAGPVQPGDAGYRLNGKIKKPSFAPRLKYESENPDSQGA